MTALRIAGLLYPVNNDDRDCNDKFSYAQYSSSTFYPCCSEFGATINRLMLMTGFSDVTVEVNYPIMTTERSR